MNTIKRIVKLEAVVLTAILLGTMIIAPVSSVNIINEQHSEILEKIITSQTFDLNEEQILDPFILDRNYIIPDPDPAHTLVDDFDDAGHRRDAGDKISRSSPLFPGEITDNTPGRGLTGKLSNGDDEDWFFFSVSEGQTFQITVQPPPGYNFDLSLWNYDAEELVTSTAPSNTPEVITYTSDYTGYWFFQISFIEGSSEGQYSFSVDIQNQDDANTGSDAGDSITQATSIAPGLYAGYLDMNDEQDWYRFNVNSGQGIHINLDMQKKAFQSDFDITLYNPEGELVYEEDYYYDDELLYPADMSGTWSIKIDIFPGWSDIPQPTEWDYYTYGSGAYELELILESSAPPLPGPVPQPDITPIAQTFIIDYDPLSSNDEYGYLASIPASNYLENNQRYVSPIIILGDDTPTNYFGTDADRGVVDDTTQYLLDDWNDYLSLNSKNAVEYQVPSNPIQAAADIASSNWQSSNLAVIAVDGSTYEDTVETVIDASATIARTVDVETLQSNDPKLQSELGGYVMMLNKDTCAVTLDALDITRSYGDESCTTLTHIFPNTYMGMVSDWWPTPYDGAGDGDDLYFPITSPGIWSVGTQLGVNDFSTFKINKISGDRYSFNVADADSTIFCKVETNTPADLLVFLVDPDGNLRAPDIPQWNGPVNPIHVWNGLENPEYNPWREWQPEDHTLVTAEVLHPEAGKWTAIVVPRYEEGTSSISYTITTEIKTTNPNRADAAISAANAAVIASQEHVPLLYVTEDSIPSETQAALASLGVSQVIFVERGGIGENVKGSLPTITTDLTTMQGIVSHIKDYSQSENYITITSIKSGDEYIAPASYMAAYHCSPVLRIGDAPANPAAVADRIQTWRLWDGDYYHGSRSPGHLPNNNEPLPGEGDWSLQTMFNAVIFLLTGGNSGSIPPIGMDTKRYWNAELHSGVYDWIDSYGLDLEGQEAYCFVAPRKDIDLVMHSVMIGNNSYAGHIPGETQAYVNDIAIRNILYPALIFANPNRDVTTSQMINFPDGDLWTTNDGVSHSVYSSRELKRTFGSNFRTYDGHCLWDAHLERMNDGASVMYYSGHGTGGSGISAISYQQEHCNYPEQIWWDSWRAYSYDNWKTARYNGRVWLNAEPPNLYDFVHYDYVDELTENLRSNAIFYMSCSTGDSFGPMVYLDHGAVMWYGNAGSGLCPEADLQDDEFFKDALINGESVGKAYSKQVWLHIRDFTTEDPTAMYGSSTMAYGGITTVQVIYADPELIIYSPSWISPVPVDA